MAVEDQPVVPAGTSATESAAPASSPAVAAPAAAPEPVAAPEPAPAPVVEPAAAPAVVEPAAPAAEPTLLQKHDAEAAAKAAKPAEPAKPEAAKPAEAKPAEPAKPVEAKPADAPKPEGEPAPAAEPAALEPVEYKYELPETIKLDDATRTSFHTALDAFRTDPAAGAQGLIDLHNKTMTDYAKSVADEQHKVWNDTRKGWQTEVMADEQLGGAGFQTTMGAIARMRDLLVPEGRRAAFDSFLQVTGAGDHPEFLRILHNAARLYDEAPMAPPNPRPAPNGGKPPSGRLRDMYKTSQPRG